jgi:glutamate-1-semialdehyde 2,1-aminomutase
VVGTAAADATLEIIAQGEVLKTIEARGSALMEGIGRVLTAAGIAHHVLGVPAMFGIAFCAGEPTDYRTWSESDNDLYERITMELVRNGAVPDPDGREPWFVCAAHTEQDVEETLNYFEDAVKVAIGG